MTDKVENFFITPMEAHFEAVPKDGPRGTIIEALEDYTPEDLMDAAEWLKRSRQAQSTFPSPRECIKAITAVIGGRQKPVVIRGEEIDGTNYASNAQAYCENRGMKDIPVIRKDTPQWEEWEAYWKWLGSRFMLGLIVGRSSITVPTQFPSQFDPRFNFIKA